MKAGKSETKEGLRAAVPNLFGTRDRFRGRQFFHGQGRGWFRDDSSILQSSSPPYVWPSSLEAQRLGTPDLG